MMHNPEIVVIGGGTGSFTLLQELKDYTPNLTAIVNMSDDGGSSGILRDELGVLPPGDIRQCLVALSNIPDARSLFNYRFEDGRLKGQSLGNMILSGLELELGSFDKAVKVASTILQITGKVLPITLDNHQLVLDDGDNRIVGEYNIAHRAFESENPKLSLLPFAYVNPEAEEAIINAEMIVIAPGNLYGSLLPALAVRGVSDAIRRNRAPKVVVSNLVTKPGQTDNWHVVDYVNKFEKYLWKNQIDYVIYNTQKPGDDLIERYANDGEHLLDTNPDRFSEISAKAIGSDIIADKIYQTNPKDLIKRTLIRHDAVKVRNILQNIFDQSK